VAPSAAHFPGGAAELGRWVSEKVGTINNGIEAELLE